MLAIQCRQICKSFGQVTPLETCNLDVPTGIVFGLLGKNGAGKTTLLRTLLGYLRPTSGTAKVCGFDIVSHSLQVRASSSYLPGDARLYRTMRGDSLLKLFAGLHQLGDFEASLNVAKRLDLDLKRRVMFMSTGMRQKLALSVVLGCQAPLVVLDEPTANLDPNVRATVLELVRETRDAGRTVVLSSHIFSDIDETCDRVAILKDGVIVVEQLMQDIGKLHVVTVELPDNDTAHEELARNVQHDFVERALVAKESRGEAELHLLGEPKQWMPWLLEQEFSNVQIERAGIRAIYQRHHSSRTLVDLKSPSR